MVKGRLMEMLLEVLDVIHDEDESATEEEKFERVLWAGSITTAEARELDLYNRYNVNEEEM